MRTNDEVKMYKLYEERNRKNQMVQFISESIRRSPWLLNEGGAPAPDPTAGMDLAAGGAPGPEGAAGGEEDPLQPIIDQLSEMTSDELLDIIQKIVVAQQEKQAAAEGGAAPEGVPPAPPPAAPPA